MVKSQNKRILLKLSGESLMGSEKYGIELEVIDPVNVRRGSGVTWQTG